MRLIGTFLTIFLLSISFLSSPALAQTASCTTVAVGATQDITAFGVCKKVTLNSVPAPGAVSICVPTNIDASQWASFYNYPPPGVTIAACAGGCAGYTYPLNGACYFVSTSGNNDSCDTVCASQGGCNFNGTKDIGSDDTSGARCAAVLSGITGTSVTANPVNTAGYYDGCIGIIYKGGWLGANYYGGSPTNCSAAAMPGRVCACNGVGGTSPCNLPWGGQIAHNANVTAYASASGTPGCTSETRTCNNGVLSGSYTNAGCTAGCALPWGGYINSGQSVTAYAAALGAPSCASQTRTCTAGALSGTYTSSGCTAGCAANQNIVWTIGSTCNADSGAVMTHGGSRTITDSGAPTTGTRNISCSAGTINQSGGSCTTAPTCSGYSYGGYCYYYAGDAVNSNCTTVCASRGGCNLAGTQYIAESSSARCSAVSTAFAGVAVTSSGITGGTGVGCYMNTYKGGWIGMNMYSPAATCGDTTTGRICGCNN